MTRQEMVARLKRMAAMGFMGPNTGGWSQAMWEMVAQTEQMGRGSEQSSRQDRLLYVMGYEPNTALPRPGAALLTRDEALDRECPSHAWDVKSAGPTVSGQSVQCEMTCRQCGRRWRGTALFNFQLEAINGSPP